MPDSKPPPAQTPPPGVAGHIWLVIAPNGEKHFVTREPPEGIVAWAAGTDATIFEYRFTAAVYLPPPKKKEPAR